MNANGSGLLEKLEKLGMNKILAMLSHSKGGAGTLGSLVGNSLGGPLGGIAGGIVGGGLNSLISSQPTQYSGMGINPEEFGISSMQQNPIPNQFMQQGMQGMGEMGGSALGGGIMNALSNLGSGDSELIKILLKSLPPEQIMKFLQSQQSNNEEMFQ